MAEEQAYAAPLVWQGTDLPVLAAGQFATSVADGEIYFTVGQADTSGPHGPSGPPMIPVRILGRYVISRRRVDELIALFERVAERYDATESERASSGGAES